MIKVLIADDQELIRQSLSIILGLKEEISVVGGVGDGTEVLEFIANSKHFSRNAVNTGLSGIFGQKKSAFYYQFTTFRALPIKKKILHVMYGVSLFLKREVISCVGFCIDDREHIADVYLFSLFFPHS